MVIKIFKSRKLYNIIIDEFFIRRFKEKDIYQFAKYRNNLTWMVHQTFKGRSEEEYRKIVLRKNNLHRGLHFAITFKDNDDLIGDLFLIKTKKTLTLGYTIDPEFANKGYMQRIIKAFVLKIRKLYPNFEIVALVRKENAISKHILEKIGFKYKGFWALYNSEVYAYK